MKTTVPSAARDGLLPTHFFPRSAAALAAFALAASPGLPRAQEPGATRVLEAIAAVEEPEVVAEALFLYDALPAGTRDVNLSFGIQRAEPDPVTGQTDLVTSPRVQLAAPLGDRVGFTVDVGVTTVGDVELDTPGAALKVLLREAGPGQTGFAASLDYFGSTHSIHESELGLGLGALRGFGPLGLRAAVAVATGVSDWAPHLHTGVSAALALGDRFRVLAEAMADVSSDETIFSAGPTLKVQLTGSTALMTGALFEVRPDAAAPLFSVQLTQTL